MKELSQADPSVIAVVNDLSGDADALVTIIKTATDKAQAAYDQAIKDSKSEDDAQAIAQGVFNENMVEEKEKFDDTEEEQIEQENEAKVKAALDTIPENKRAGVVKNAERIANAAAKKGKNAGEKTSLGDAAYIDSVTTQCAAIAKAIADQAAADVAKRNSKSAEVQALEDQIQALQSKIDALKGQKALIPAKLVLGDYSTNKDTALLQRLSALPQMFAGEAEVSPVKHEKTATGYSVLVHATVSGYKVVQL